jgi:hypothetical protein
MVCAAHPFRPLLNITLHQFQVFEAGKEVHCYSLAIGNQLSEMQMLLADMKVKQHGALSVAVASLANTWCPPCPAGSTSITGTLT